MNTKYDFQIYNNCIKNVLNILASWIQESTINNIYSKDINDFGGRTGSTNIEKTIIKPSLINNKQFLIPFVNKEKNNKDFELLDIIDPEIDDSESSKRTWADIFIKIKLNKNILEIPINIKATDSSNSSADNTASWRAFGFIMLSNSDKTLTREIEIVNKIIDDGIELDGQRDYFIWTFYKQEDRPFFGYKSFSLLEYNPKYYTYNRSQSFPLQINTKKLIEDNLILSFSQRKERFANWLIENNNKYFQDRLDLNKKFQNKLKQMSSK